MSTTLRPRLLLATEHSEFDRGAEALAFALAHRHAVPLPVVMPMTSNAEFEAVAPELAARADAAAAARLDDLARAAAQVGVPLVPEVRHGPVPYAEIVAEAAERGTELLIIRRRGRRGLLANLLIGEMVSKVVAHAPCSVLIAPRNARLWSRAVMVGLDPEHPAPTLLTQAHGLATEYGLPLHVVCVAGHEARRAEAERILADALRGTAAGPGALASSGEVRVGSAHAELLAAAAARGADLLVVARRGPQTLARAWIGGVAQKVIGLAECPVLVHVPASGP
jgi:hypothetical protein